MAKYTRIKEWSDTLSEEQVRTLVVELVDSAITSEDVSFYESSQVPYWANNGEPLVEGQVPYLDED